MKEQSAPQRIFSYEPDRESPERQRVILRSRAGTFRGLLGKESYSHGDHFHIGQRATVMIGLREGNFQEWADVVFVEDDTIMLRLSHDALPEGVLLNEGTSVLMLVGEHGSVNSGFSCRAEIISAASTSEVLVRCLEEVKSNGLREYFRCNAEIPATLFNLSSGVANSSPVSTSALQGTTSCIVDISGGGIRTESPDEIAEGDIVYVTFHLPLPEPIAVPVVAQAVYSKEVNKSGGPYFSSGLRYLHINERDRDNIVRFVCNEEIKRMRRYKEG